LKQRNFYKNMGKELIKVVCKSVEETKAMFPKCYAFADAVRREFGDGVKLVYAEENGRCIGRKTVVDPDRVLRISDLCLGSSEFADATERSKQRGKK
jgi:hypothetical protein